jgi:hypothetical protein
MFTIRHRKEFDERYPGSQSNLLLEVVVAYTVYSVCVDVLTE